MKFLLSLVALFLALFSPVSGHCQTEHRQPAARSPKKPAEWHFVISGDSRNCGDFIMPAIAEGASRHRAAFYWHLGDFRAMRAPDQDLLGEIGEANQTSSVKQYQDHAWDDFLKMQIEPFEKRGIPVFLGIGNHEVIPPKTRPQYVAKFAKWIDSPGIKKQRLTDNPAAGETGTYYHWRQGGIDFINLDNASSEQFDPQQIAWFNKVLKQDREDPAVLTIVVGMHKSLPDSISNWHSMSESPEGMHSGRCVYKSLVKAQTEGHKRVYVLASHSHFYMPDIYNTAFWRSNQSTKGVILPGWIVGTAGAIRYRLPDNSPKEAQTDVYGYLLATVNAGGKPGAIDFQFKQIRNNQAEGEDFVPDNVKKMFSSEAQQYCLNGNSDMAPAKLLAEPPDVPCPQSQ
jgi:Calcineurin-like phosphoesterase